MDKPWLTLEEQLKDIRTKNKRNNDNPFSFVDDTLEESEGLSIPVPTKALNRLKKNKGGFK